MTTSQVTVENLPAGVSDYTVSIDIAHPQVDQLTGTLIAPDGARARLFANVGGNGTGFSGTTFADSAATPIASGSAPFTGYFRPEESLASLLQADVNGTWTLEIDNRGTSHSGQILGWNLSFGGEWDFLDYGEYVISTVAGKVSSASGGQSTESRDIGSFDVKITDDPSVLYVDTLADDSGAGSLRNAIIAANAVGAPRAIILDTGRYTIGIPHQADPASTFPDVVEFCELPQNVTGWSDAGSGDFDIMGSITIIGNQNDFTVIDAVGLDRVFKVHPNASLDLRRVTVAGGVAPSDQYGGGILSAGDLTIRDSILRGNAAIGIDAGGGAIAALSGNATLSKAWIDDNQSGFGGGVYLCGTASGNITQSTFSDNRGGGMHSDSRSTGAVSNSTFSANSGGEGAIFIRDNRANRRSGWPSISADGRFVVFESEATNLVSDDFNNGKDIFVYDRVLAGLERVSVASDGTEANDISRWPAMSSDGRFVSFLSRASNLVPGDSNAIDDVFVYDRELKAIERVNVANDGSESNNASYEPAISGNGRFVAFVSYTTNLVPGDTNGSADVFFHDRELNTIERISLASDGTEANGSSSFPSISDDGRFVAFSSHASNLVSGDTNGTSDIFVYDRQLDVIERVSVSSGGNQANSQSVGPSLSADGQFVAFRSYASNLVPVDTNDTADIFVHDRELGITERISIASDGTQGNGGSDFSSISADGRFVAFDSLASNLVLGDTNGAKDVFVYDRDINRIERLSVTSDGNEANGRSQLPSISADGQSVVFESVAANIVSGIDFPHSPENVFLNDRSVGQIKSLTSDPSGLVVVTQSTLVDTTDAPVSVSGIVALQDSFVFSQIPSHSERVDTSNNIDRAFLNASRFDSELYRDGFDPPVHRLFRGHPAIDAGDPAFTGTVDQLGVVREVPDIGAVETVSASIAGAVFVDLDDDQQLGPEEPGLRGITLEFTSPDGLTSVVTTNSQGNYDLDSFAPTSLNLQVQVQVPPEFSIGVRDIRSAPHEFVTNGASTSTSLSVNGRFVGFYSDASNLVSGDENGKTDVFVYDIESLKTQRVSVTSDGTEGNDNSAFPSLSADGRFVAFSSFASNLVPGDTNADSDIFVYDRDSGKIERISVASDGSQANGRSQRPSISADGRFVAFQSDASNLVVSDVNERIDVFVYDRELDTIERVSIASDGGEGNSHSTIPSLSANGRFVVFTSFASNLVPDDTNGQFDVFVFDRESDTIERVSIAGDLTEGNGSSAQDDPAYISADGRFVAFSSSASNLVPDDTNGAYDVFVRDRDTGITERISVGNDGTQANHVSKMPSLSADGRFVAFRSLADNLVLGVPARWRVYVYDRGSDVIQLVSVAKDKTPGNNVDSFPTISPDGRFVAFSSLATNLVLGDTNGLLDVFVAPNPLGDFSRVLLPLVAGDVVTDQNFALVPDSGRISGRLFLDNRVLNGVYDLGETFVAGRTVFVDSNLNGALDLGEKSDITDSEGLYEFSDIAAHREQVIVVPSIPGLKQVAPKNEAGAGFTVFLPAGGDLREIDFGFRPVTTTGQSSDSSIRGRVMIDFNRNGVLDDEDQPFVGRPVYMDAGELGVRDFDDPQVVTDENGFYQFEGLPATVTPLRVNLENDREFEQVAPLGSDFTSLERFPLQGVEKRSGNPQAVVTANFDQDENGFQDVAVVLAETNTLSIRINDGIGGFTSRVIDLNLSLLAGPGGNFSQPTSIVVGTFDADPRVDVALTGNFSSTVLVLRNFDAISGAFGSSQLVAVGEEPLEVLAGQFAGDDQLDLVVLTKTASKLQILTNDGSGVFTAGPPLSTGGVLPSSIVTANFAGDASQDIVVVHAIRSLTDVTTGRITLLVGDGMGGLTLSPTRYDAQAAPQDAAVGDFNQDGIADLTVVNTSSQSISVLLGQADGSFRIQSAVLGTTEGAVDVAIADIDNDGDEDILASKLQKRRVAIFRNIGTDADSGEVRFEPQENIPLGEFSFAERMPFALTNLDNDTSGPNGTGTIDIVAVPQNTDTLYVLKNRLVQGSRRAAVSGARSDIADNIDFLVRPAILPPLLDPITPPAPVVEDALTQSILISGIAKGRAGGPSLQFEVISSNTDLIDDAVVTHVAGQSTGTLTYTPKRNANGIATLTVVVTDAGANGVMGDADDGISRRTVPVTVLAVNDAPAFNLPATLSVNEGPDPQSIAGFVTDIGLGGAADEATQTLFPFTVTADDNSQFVSLPAIDSQGRLTFTPLDNVFGTVNVTVSLKDNGGTADGGIDEATRSFVLTIQPVNDRPSITIGGNQTSQEGANQQTVGEFASGFDPGINEATQTISDFIVRNDNNLLFAVQPDIDNNGTLTYTPAAIANGVAVVTVQVRDSGGTERSGADVSIPQTFTITVTATPDTTSPAPVLSSNQPSLTNQTSFDVFVDFREAVVGFTEQLLSIAGATAGSAVDLGDGRYRIPMTTPDDGVVLIALAAGKVTDVSGNPNIAATPLAIEVDRSALVPTLQTGAPRYLSAAAFDVSIDFGEWVTGFTKEDFTLINGTVGNFPDLGGGRYSATITSTQEGEVMVLVPSSAAKDQAGNDSKSSVLLSVHVDMSAPLPMLMSLDPSPTKPARFNVEVDFGEAVSGFEPGDLVLSSGQVSAFSDRGEGRYLVTLDNLSEGAFTLSLAASAADDRAGNASLAAADLNVTVEIVNPDTIILEGDGNTFFLNQLGSSLDAVQLIDIRGAGNNTLMLDAEQIATTFAGGQILVLSNTGDRLVFDAGWRFERVFVDGGRLIRQFVNGLAVLNLIGPDDFTNPMNLFDVNFSGDVTALDALQVVNELSRQLFSDASGPTPGSIRPYDESPLNQFRFYDVNRDGRITALDALNVINGLARFGGDGEQVALPNTPRLNERVADEVYRLLDQETWLF